MSDEATPPAPRAAERHHTELEITATAIGAVAFVIAATLALVVLGVDPAPISGTGSLGQFAAMISAAAAALAYAGGRVLLHVRGRTRIDSALDVIDIAAVALAHGIITLLGWTLVAHLLAASFQGATVFAIATLALSGATAAVSAYVAFLSAAHMDAQLLAIVLATFLVMGVLASMLTASDPLWWMEHLSALGVTEDISALAFNLTLIVAGFLVTVLARAATRALPSADAHGESCVRTCLILVGIFLGLVGVFQVDSFFWIHTAVASGMAVAFIVLTVKLHTWVPGIAPAFLPVGWGFSALTVVVAVCYSVGYYSLTAVELVAGVLVFTWLILFLRNVGALGADISN